MLDANPAPMKFDDGNCFLRCMALALRTFGYRVSPGQIGLWENALLPYYKPGSSNRVPSIAFRHSSRVYDAVAQYAPISVTVKRFASLERLLTACLQVPRSRAMSVVFLNSFHIPYTDDYHVRAGGAFSDSHCAFVVGQNAGVVYLVDPTRFPRASDPTIHSVPYEDFVLATSDGAGIGDFAPFRAVEIWHQPESSSDFHKTIRMKTDEGVLNTIRALVIPPTDKSSIETAVGGPLAWVKFIVATQQLADVTAALALEKLFVQIYHFFRFTRRTLAVALEDGDVVDTRSRQVLSAKLEESERLWTAVGQASFLTTKKFGSERLSGIARAIERAIAHDATLAEEFGSLTKEDTSILQDPVQIERQTTPLWLQLQGDLIY
jgi:hypothetical protein